MISRDGHGLIFYRRAWTWGGPVGSFVLKTITLATWLLNPAVLFVLGSHMWGVQICIYEPIYIYLYTYISSLTDLGSYHLTDQCNTGYFRQISSYKKNIRQGRDFIGFVTWSVQLPDLQGWIQCALVTSSGAFQLHIRHIRTKGGKESLPDMPRKVLFTIPVCFTNNTNRFKGNLH